MKSEFSNTRRGVLRVTGSVFDPLALAAPYLIKAKLIIQELQRCQIEWDDVLPNNIGTTSIVTIAKACSYICFAIPLKLRMEQLPTSVQ